MGLTNKYKNGMRVVFTGKALSESGWKDLFYPPDGTHGVIANADGTTNPGIVWDNFTPYPNCKFDGRLGAYYDDRNWEIEELSYDKILIMRDKKDPMRIIARDLGTNKTAEARCNPQDEFKFETGARLALDRLFGTETTEKKDPPAKFKVGDVVIGNDKAYAYGITKPGWIGYVVSVGPSKGIIRVKESKNAHEYPVLDMCFDLYRPEFKIGDRVRMRDPGDFTCSERSLWATDRIMTVKEYLPASDAYLMEENPYAFAPHWLVKVLGWNGRFTPVDTNDLSRWWTNGKIYEVEDGVLRDDDGEIRYHTDDKLVVDFADLQSLVPFKILEIKD